MENNIQIFNNNVFGQIRTINIAGKVYFVAKDVAIALGYKDTTNAVKLHCRGVVKHHLIDSLARKQIANVIPKEEIYKFVTNSKLSSAKKFESWIFDEVIPIIRKTGRYSVKPEQQTLLACIEDLIIQQATLLKELRLKLESQQQQIDELKHKPFSQYNTYRSCEAWLKMKGIPYQKQFFWAFSRRCAKYSRENNIPVQQVGKKGYAVNAYREDVLERCFSNKLALPAQKKIETLEYFVAKFFNEMTAEMRLNLIKAWDEWKKQIPIKFRKAFWQALTTDIHKIPQYTELKKICRAE